MKPKLKTEIIKHTYWACHIPEHRHPTERTAAICMMARASMDRAQRHQKWLTVSRAFLNGATYKEAGALVGVTGERARRLTLKTLNEAKIFHTREDAESYGFDVKCIRKKAILWLARCDALEQKWNSDTQY